MVRSGDHGSRQDVPMRLALTASFTIVAVVCLGGCTQGGDSEGTPIEPASMGSGWKSTTVCVNDDGPIEPDGLLTPCSVNGLAFGMSRDLVMPAAVEMFGPFDFDGTEEYPEAVDGGRFTDDLGTYEFAFPIDYSACFPNSLCLTFGGASESDLLLVGWQLLGGSVTDVDLATPSGVTLGSRWADHLDEMVMGTACGWSANATVDGVNVSLLSSEDLFGEDGELAEELPDAATVTVASATAGEIASDPDAPC
jgi:hypothetical protein